MKKSIKIIEKALGDLSIKIQRTYTGLDVSMSETRVVQAESDFNAVTENRISIDNGKTWTPYKTDADYYKRDGEKEILKVVGAVVPNKVTGQVVRTVMERIFLYDHKKVYEYYWTTGNLDWRDHTYIEFSDDNGITFPKRFLLAYEDNKGSDFNLGYHGTNIEVDADGSVYTCISTPLNGICRAYNLKVVDYAKSPVVTNGVIVFTIKYKNGSYTVDKSQPVIIKDSRSSRGLMEPNIVSLKSGEFMLECRGTNAVSDGWETNMKPVTSSHRWVSFSSDGAEFSDIKPLTFENNELFYSPSSISRWVRHSLSEKLYWVGNITPENPIGNRPRYPLVIVQFDEEQKCFLKDSVMVLDDRLPGEGELIQHSNFTFYEDRQTHAMHIEYSRLGQNPDYTWQGDAVRITLEEE